MGGVIEDLPVNRKSRLSSEQQGTNKDTPKQAVSVKLRLTERVSCSRVSANGSDGSAAILTSSLVEQKLALFSRPSETSLSTSKRWLSARV